MTMLGILTPGQKLVTEHTNRYAADAKKMEDDCFFLRYFREGLRRYLGSNPLLAVEMEECRHCFGEPYPVIFTVVLSIGEPGMKRTYCLPCKARWVDEKSYAIESHSEGTVLDALSMTLETPDENNTTYQKIIERFQWQFGEKGKYRLNIDDGSAEPMPDAAATPCDAEGTGVA